MNDIGPGDLVECVNDNFTNVHKGETAPIAGNIYTIRGANSDGYFWLEEIVNEPKYYWNGHEECAFDPQAFRPVRSTDISVFTEIDAEVHRGAPREIEVMADG